MIVRNTVSKYALTSGFISAFIGYSFHKCLWYMAFYHLIAFAFVAYTFAIFKECETIRWKKISFIVFISALNAFTDELSFSAMVFNWSEYVSLGIIAIYLYFKK